MSATIRKASTAANVQFGIGTGITVTGMLVQGFTDDYGSQKGETPDTSGSTVAAAFYDNKRALTVECLFNSASEPTAVPGDNITVNGLAGQIDTISRMKSATEFYKTRYNVTVYVDNTLT